MAYVERGQRVTAGQLTDEILRRVRDVQGTANPRAVVRDYLQRAQILFVRNSGTLITESTLTLTPERLVWDIDPQVTLRILDLFIGERRLWPIRWPGLSAQRGPQWWRGAADSGPRVWAPLSTIHFVVYPAVTAASTETTLTIRAQRRPADLTDDASPMELPDDYFPRLLDFVEAAVLLRQRDVALPEALKRVAGESSPEQEEVA